MVSRFPERPYGVQSMHKFHRVRETASIHTLHIAKTAGMSRTFKASDAVYHSPIRVPPLHFEVVHRETNLASGKMNLRCKCSVVASQGGACEVKRKHRLSLAIHHIFVTGFTT
ncbi:hypothetical protein U1Q18_044760 [Sarracenia purpurea var. burkii]